MADRPHGNSRRNDRRSDRRSIPIPFGVRNAIGIPGLPTSPSLSEFSTEEDNANALAWMTRCGEAPRRKTPKALLELSFSKNSGPEGMYSKRESQTRLFTNMGPL